eukprot:scaffold453_cov187-Ochromonas_danica.AAC.8
MSSNSMSPPPEIRAYVSDYQWSVMYDALSRVEATLHGSACICEACVCIFLAFPFIFLCHPCVYAGLASCGRNGEIRRLNNLLFRDAPVLGTRGLYYTFNTDLATPMSPYPNVSMNPPVVVVTTSQPQPQPAFAAATFVNQPNGAAASGNGAMAYATYADPPTAVPVGSKASVYEEKPAQPITRQAMIVIPEGVSPGQVLTVAVDGQTLHVPVETHHRPGDQVIIAY